MINEDSEFKSEKIANEKMCCSFGRAWFFNFHEMTIIITEKDDIGPFLNPPSMYAL